MNSIVLEEINVIGHRLECRYTVKGEWRRYFRDTDTYFAEYGRELEGIPKSIAVIPFLCNVLPLVWIFNAEVLLEDIDRDFYESIEDFKRGYVNMYPNESFRGKITARRITDNNRGDLDGAAVFFSGGVDAYHTLISHIEEKPILVTLWGADIPFEDPAGWELVDQHIQGIAHQNHLEYIPIKTSFRRFLNEVALNEYAFRLIEDDWWHAFQHGIGIIGHIAPLAYQYKIKTVYIASSLTIEDISNCASDPSIDNYVRFFGCRVIHDGYEYSRPEKTDRISVYVKKTGKPIQLRVCWESKGGSNCCHCEKCYRTILCLLAGKNDPREYGFHYREEEFAGMMKDFRIKLHLLDATYFVVYRSIQNLMRNNYTRQDIIPELRWFYRADLDKEQSFQKRLLYRFIRKGKNLLRSKAFKSNLF